MADADRLANLVEWIARELVDDRSAVRVRSVGDGRQVMVELRVASADMGKVIGRQGRMVKAIRTLVKAAAVRAGVRATVEILD